LQRDALRIGIGIAELWDMTPAEVYATIEAYLWRDEQAQKREVAMAWRTAMLSRAKKIPPLSELLTPKQSRPVTGKERERLHSDFEQMAGAIDLEAIGKRKK